MKKQNKIMIEIITSHGCAKCQKTNELVRNMLNDAQDIEIKERSIVEHPDIAVEYGIVTTPALIINHKLVFTGVPDQVELKKVIDKHRSERNVD